MYAPKKEGLSMTEIFLRLFVAISLKTEEEPDRKKDSK